MQIQELQREFKYNSVTLADPNPAFTLQQVRDFYASVYPEIVNADIDGPDAKGNKNVYTFRRAVGTKGGSTPTAMVIDLGALLHGGWLDDADAEFVKSLQERAPNAIQKLNAEDSLRLITLHRKQCGPKPTPMSKRAA
jgi:PRTRC genetic system protein C